MLGGRRHRDARPPGADPAPEAALATHSVHEAAFRGAAGGVWLRVAALVVQPGVEFGHEDVAIYVPGPARALAATLERMPGLVFEAHSTDYQPEASLRRLAGDGLLSALHDVRIPETLISRHLPRLHGRAMASSLPPNARALLIEAVRGLLRAYSRGCRSTETP